MLCHFNGYKSVTHLHSRNGGSFHAFGLHDDEQKFELITTQIISYINLIRTKACENDENIHYEVILKNKADQYEMGMRLCIELIEQLVCVNKYDALPKEYIEKYERCLEVLEHERKKSVIHCVDTSWKAVKITHVIEGGVRPCDSGRYIDFILDVMNNTSEEKLSRTSQSFYNDIIRRKNFLNKAWKAEMLRNVVEAMIELKHLSCIHYLAYYNETGRYRNGKKTIEELFSN